MVAALKLVGHRVLSLHLRLMEHNPPEMVVVEELGAAASLKNGKSIKLDV